MKKKNPARRDFLKLSTLGLGSFAMTSAGMIEKNKSNPDKRLRIVCIGAHPGDPEFGCGGTMAQYSNAGHLVTFIYLTRGEASDPSKSYAEMAAMRTKEAETSCKILNAKPVFVGQIDGNTILSNEKTAEMQKLVDSENPDIVFTQWPVDSHPDHQVTGLATLSAWIKSGRRFQLYFFEVNTGSETMAFTPTDYVDITSVRDKKKAAMYAHKTQAPEETYNGFFKAMEEFRGLEAGVKAAEAFMHFKAGNERANILGL